MAAAAMFPALVGMNRPTAKPERVEEYVPRTRGDEPPFYVDDSAGVSMFPALVGMNRPFLFYAG